MSDARLRALEQAWRASGEVEDHVAFLTEQVRRGVLDLEGVRLAAYCGHEAAREFLGVDAPVYPTQPVSRPRDPRREVREAFSLESWLQGLRDYPQAASVRVALALMVQLKPTWAQSASPHWLLRRALLATEGWLLDPTEETQARARETQGRLDELWFVQGTHEPGLRCGSAAARAAAAAGPSAAADALEGLGSAADSLLEGPLFEATRPPESVTREVATWALDLQDVVRRRVGERTS